MEDLDLVLDGKKLNLENKGDEVRMWVEVDDVWDVYDLRREDVKALRDYLNEFLGDKE